MRRRLFFGLPLALPFAGTTECAPPAPAASSPLPIGPAFEQPTIRYIVKQAEFAAPAHSAFPSLFPPGIALPHEGGTPPPGWAWLELAGKSHG